VVDTNNDALTDCYEVEIIQRTTVFVRGAKSSDEAYEFAETEIMGGTRNIVERKVTQLKASEVNASYRHADERSEP
jgi:hypothetical protein